MQATGAGNHQRKVILFWELVCHRPGY